MAGVFANELTKITSFPKLVDLLRDKLDWPIGEDYGFEDVVYEYQANELGLKAEETAKIREIHQLRPLTTKQPWGIFFISFEEKTISVTVLRRMLRALVVKKRAGVQSADRQTWQLHDLIFVTNFGKSGERELAFAHFSDGKDTGDLPVLNVLGWNAKDTQLHNEYVASVLNTKLRWPEDSGNHHEWRERWAVGFEVRYREVIKTSKDLAIRLAALATDIRARANELLRAESDRGSMRKMLGAFRKNLIRDLDEDGFADMFAQTIAYGLLAARISRQSGALVADNLADMAPKTNPFLKELFETFLSLGGRDKRKAMDFDELGVRDVVEVLRRVNMEAVLRDFGDRNPKEDPVIHFYELFLQEYDPKKRLQRGVFYTPRPVVNFIVRGVDEVLRTEFDLPLGLADTTTWGELAARNDRVTVPDHVKTDTPFVQILDPATGTGTFLVEVIDLVHTRMVKHWQAKGMQEAEIKATWNAYVPKHLLPRLAGFELMMAPYSIAHMKIGLKLAETGYTFSSNERARIFLTNTLEPARDLDMEFIFMAEALAHEAQAANGAKSNTAFTVIIGNPPYSGFSSNMSDYAQSLVQRYRFVDGKPLGERKLWLQNDYVKFFGIAQSFLDRSAYGVLGFISDNSFLDGPTFRGLRANWLSNTRSLRIVDLAGKATVMDDRAKEKDENVFDIGQGTAITIANYRHNKSSLENTAATTIHGSCESKFNRLLNSSLKSIGLTHGLPRPPFFDFFSKLVSQTEHQYDGFIPLNRLFVFNCVGVQTSRDPLAIGLNEIDLLAKINFFKNQPIDIVRETFFREQSKSKFPRGDTRQWTVSGARQRLYSGSYEPTLGKLSYRPFDERCFVSDDGLSDWPRLELQAHLSNENLCLAILRRTENKRSYDYVFVAANTPWNHLTSIKDGTYGLPLWLKPSAGETVGRPNLDRSCAKEFGASLELDYLDGTPRVEQTSMGVDYRHKTPKQTSLLSEPWNGCGDLNSTFGPRDVFDWIYAVLHSPDYRSRYAEFLKSDFPRIPIPKDRAIFQALTLLGGQLVSLHLLKSDQAPVLCNPEVTFHGSGEARVAKGFPKYENGKVMINAACWFEDIRPDIWNFHIGGYQVCEKWLKDRAGKGGKKSHPGRVLSDNDILHYRRITIAIRDTIALMKQVDETITTHGGWPDAFYQAPPPPPSVEEIIQADENMEIEFKSTFQWDVKENRKNPELQKSCLKTVAAFLNTKGGTLVIGVSDDKQIIGLVQDLKLTRDSLDWFEQTFRNVLDDAIGVDFSPYCNVRFSKAPDGKDVCIVEVRESKEPVFLSFRGKQEFFIRRGNATKTLNAREQHDYVRKRFS